MPSFITPFYYFFPSFPFQNTYSFQIGSVCLLILLIFLSIVCLYLLEYKMHHDDRALCKCVYPCIFASENSLWQTVDNNKNSLYIEFNIFK